MSEVQVVLSSTIFELTGVIHNLPIQGKLAALEEVRLTLLREETKAAIVIGELFAGHLKNLGHVELALRVLDTCNFIKENTI